MSCLGGACLGAGGRGRTSGWAGASGGPAARSCARSAAAAPAAILLAAARACCLDPLAAPAASNGHIIAFYIMCSPCAASQHLHSACGDCALIRLSRVLVLTAGTTWRMTDHAKAVILRYGTNSLTSASGALLLGVALPVPSLSARHGSSALHWALSLLPPCASASCATSQMCKGTTGLLLTTLIILILHAFPDQGLGAFCNTLLIAVLHPFLSLHFLHQSECKQMLCRTFLTHSTTLPYLRLHFFTIDDMHRVHSVDVYYLTLKP